MYINVDADVSIEDLMYATDSEERVLMFREMLKKDGVEPFKNDIKKAMFEKFYDTEELVKIIADGKELALKMARDAKEYGERFYLMEKKLYG
jgi:hypothetical protein